MRESIKKNPRKEYHHHHLSERLDILELIEDAIANDNMSPDDACKSADIHPSTYYRWKRKHWKNLRGRMASKARREKEIKQNRSKTNPKIKIANGIKNPTENTDSQTRRFEELDKLLKENKLLRNLMSEFLLETFLQTNMQAKAKRMEKKP